MKDILLACVTHRGLERDCAASVAATGAPFLQVEGCADIALARNRALTLALSEAIKANAHTVVLLDDDMVFTASDVATLVDTSRALRTPVSAAYSLKSGALAASRYSSSSVVGEPWMSHLWLCGLGLMAVPTGALLELSKQSETIDADGPVTVFTWSGSDGEQWVGEDYRLCMRLGGAILAPVAAGHVKRVTLTPDVHSIETIRAGQELNS